MISILGTKADEMKVTMSNGFLDKAQTALNRKDHATSSVNFERAYKTSLNGPLTPSEISSFALNMDTETQYHIGFF